MAEKFVSERNLKFLLYEVMGIEDLTAYPIYSEHNREIFDLVIETALKLARDLMLPYFKEMDHKPPVLVDGRVQAHPMIRSLLQECGQGGWIAASAPFELGGQQLPITLALVYRFIMSAANYSASIFPGLTSSAAHLIQTFGSPEMIETYLPKMYAGEWQGTMAMTEPQAGSSLSDITTQAIPTDKGYYRIRGQKIFISAGDHDGADNIIHLMLAKIKGAPPGVKGISLFIVPKLRPEGDRLVPNDVSVVGLYHKMGYRGGPLTQLALGEKDDCRGYLVGEPHKGLSYMFQMMNEARLDVGLSAVAIASAAYYASLEYTRIRPQGRKISAKDPTKPQVPIIEHADVRRMLLFQRAIVEGSLSLSIQCSKYADLERVTEGPEKEHWFLLLDLLTPVAKSYPSEMGILSVSQGLQCLGGYGYTDEFPLEQYFRDMRIHPIHEGTTGIQAMDLLGRKVVMKNGLALTLFIQEVEKVIKVGAADPVLQPYAHRLEEALDSLKKVTSQLVGLAMTGDAELFLADATLYLEFFGIICVAWQWLVQGLAIQKGLQGRPEGAEADFYLGKLQAMKFFFHYELPKTLGLAKRLIEGDGLTARLDISIFND